jgi:hypothetical protein
VNGSTTAPASGYGGAASALRTTLRPSNSHIPPPKSTVKTANSSASHPGRSLTASPIALPPAPIASDDQPIGSISLTGERRPADTTAP